MKKLILTLFLLPSIAFGQQILWSTTTDQIFNKSEEIKHISIEQATSEVLKLYDFYKLYYDGTGFTKDGLEKMSEGSQSQASYLSDWKDLAQMFEEIERPVVFAMKGNDGRGSYVAVIHVNKQNIDVIAFSNHFIGASSQVTSDSEKFGRWFDSLLDYESSRRDSLSPLYDRTGGFGYASLSLDNRRFVVSPKLEDDGMFSGKIAVEIRADRDGKIISARAGVRGTTLSNIELLEKCERAALGSQLNRLEKAPPVQTGVIVFKFRLKEPDTN